jgi:mono/diheme cytochrome c family protein
MPAAEQTSPTPEDAKPAAAAQTPVERGKYLTLVGGCNDCHTPKNFGPNGPEADMSRELSGHPAGDKIPAVPQKLFPPAGNFGTLTNGHLTAWIGPWGISYAYESHTR